MFSDIVIPKNNEAEFIEVALKLNINKIYFLYNFDEYNDKIQEKLNSLEENKKMQIEIGFIVNQKNINKAFKQSKLLVVKSSDKDRFFIESKKIKLIYGFEETQKKDYLHQRASGLNHILCELARNNNVAIGFSYGSLFNKTNPTKALLIGRMIQNISLCQKYKVKTVVGSFSEKPFDLRANHDITSFFSLLGINIKNIRQSL